MEKISNTEDNLVVGQSVPVKVFAIPGLGDFPAPYSTSSIDYNVTEIVKNEGNSGTGSIGHFFISNVSTEDFYIYGSDPTLNMNVSGGNPSTPQTMGTGVFGPINQNIRISLTPIINTGYYKLEVENYIAEGYKNHNITYTFRILKFKEESEYKFQEVGNIFRKPETYINNTGASFYGLHIEAHDKTDNKKYVPIPLPESETCYSTIQEVRNVCASGQIFELDQDVDAPNISLEVVVLFDSSAAYRINNIIDDGDNLVMEEDGTTKITYYLIPNSNSTPWRLHD